MNICNRKYYNNEAGIYVRCKGIRLKDYWTCANCKKEIQENKLMRIKSLKKYGVKSLFDWKYNGKKLLIGGVLTQIPKNYLYLNIKL